MEGVKKGGGVRGSRSTWWWVLWAFCGFVGSVGLVG
jgi:hypothetical protein